MNFFEALRHNFLNSILFRDKLFLGCFMFLFKNKLRIMKKAIFESSFLHLKFEASVSRELLYSFDEFKFCETLFAGFD